MFSAKFSYAAAQPRQFQPHTFTIVNRRRGCGNVQPATLTPRVPRAPMVRPDEGDEGHAEAKQMSRYSSPAPVP